MDVYTIDIDTLPDKFYDELNFAKQNCRWFEERKIHFKCILEKYKNIKTMTCAYCGSTHNYEMKQCGNCGAPLHRDKFNKSKL
jgi:aspartate carbamoyltransferase regulatory subunit